MKALLSLAAVIAAVGLFAQLPAVSHEANGPPKGHQPQNGNHGPPDEEEPGDEDGPAFVACPEALQHVLDLELEGFVAFIVDPEDTQARPIQCFDSGATVTECDYVSDSNHPCDVTGLFAPQSIDIYESSLTSCNTSGGRVRCNTIDFP